MSRDIEGFIMKNQQTLEEQGAVIKQHADSLRRLEELKPSKNPINVVKAKAIA